MWYKRGGDASVNFRDQGLGTNTVQQKDTELKKSAYNINRLKSLISVGIGCKRHYTYKTYKQGYKKVCYKVRVRKGTYCVRKVEDGFYGVETSVKAYMGGAGKFCTVTK